MTQSNYVYSGLDKECWAETVRAREREKDSDTIKSACVCVCDGLCV